MKPKKPLESLILTLREQRVMLAPDLADVYGVETRVLNQAVKRNAERFPGDFIFQLTPGEFSALKAAGQVAGDGPASLRSQIVILNNSINQTTP
jgi:ORF6N domain